ncbi:hypothetical protein OJ963_40670 [Streptomyces sp. RS2]|uniref:hypothetical protein n=1 Tax=Streptomyces sp. RS2 TaxID=1451205 RepID=UPI0021F853B9|nr:hypothetical protein [Streptomyces sp. RS2]MCW1100104.1 hypothetical protein [Streptomyces sp. RS2]
MSADMPHRSRLDNFLRAGSDELEATLAAATDVGERMPAHTERSSDRTSSRLDSLLEAGDADLQRSLAGSINVEDKLATSLTQLAQSESDRRTLPRSVPIAH